MKAIHYDTEGDILSVTFTEAKEQKHIGLELSDNIVFYYNPEIKIALRLLLLSYRALLQTSTQAPILLDGLSQAPVEVQATVTALLKCEPLTAFIQVIEARDQTLLTGRLHEIFTPTTLQTVTAS